MNPQKNLGYRLLMMGLLILLSGNLNISQVQAQISPSDWQKDWEVAPGWSISLDSDGFELPTGIAFVPNPGEEPKDPLYYVIELRGKIKVVTNDRSIFTFAEDFFYTETPADITGDVNVYGLVGLCLEPTNGFVFVTYLTRLEDGTFRNRITRFQSQPNTFSQTFTDKIDITSMFQNHPESFPLTIGRCFTQDEYLYVGVGYGNNALNAQSLDSPLGKILRMTFDGLPIPENPFYIDSAPDNPKKPAQASVLGLAPSF